MSFYLVVHLIIINAAGMTSGDDHELKLHSHLMSSYNNVIRATHDHRLPTNVTFGFSLHQLIDVDEKNQLITTSCWLNINWLDRKLMWNKSDFGGIDMIHLPADKVWKPDIMLLNNADSQYNQAMVSTDVFITNEGNVTWLSFAIFYSSCPISVRHYPFDEQHCPMTFSSWSYDIYELNLTTIIEEGDLSNFVPNGEWNLISVKTIELVQNFTWVNNPWPLVQVWIRIQRIPLFYVFNHILPCALITAMGLLGFYVPVNSGEKVTMCITAMLSMGVFMNAVNENMPATSESLPLISMFYTASFVIVCAVTLVNVIVLNIYYRGNSYSPSEVPPWMKRFILGFLASFLHVRLHVNLLKQGYSKLRRAYTITRRRTIRRPRAHLRRSSSAPTRSPRRKLSPSASSSVPPRKKISESAMSSYTLAPPQIVVEPVEDAVSEVALQRKWVRTATKRVHRPSPWILEAKKLMDAQGEINRQLGERDESGISVDSDATLSPPLPPQPQPANLPMRREFEKAVSDVLESIVVALDKNDHRNAVEDLRLMILWEWKMLTKILDRMLFWLFVCAVVSSLFFMLIEPTLREFARISMANYYANISESDTLV